VSDFERMIEDYRMGGTQFADEDKASRFNEKITGIHDLTSPFSTWYNSITAQPQETVTYEYVKERFIAVDTSSSSKENSHGWKSNDSKSLVNSQKLCNVNDDLNSCVNPLSTRDVLLVNGPASIWSSASTPVIPGNILDKSISINSFNVRAKYSL